mgnify:CR=1 FL=1|tara:strand:+ start:2670 stop:3062 length:393 start_codon:yes stop_codon:yes gene_type:complete
MTENTPTKKRGRPRKSLVESKKTGNRVKRGRPAGDAAAINEFKARLLASPRSQKVLDSIMSAALNDEHKNQAAAWKLLMDRMLPISYFEKDKNNAGRSAVSITITGVGGETVITPEPNIIEGEVIDDDER